ncbi:P-loop containing nucleoside triphosphate hydrolase protein [Nemania sp. FL0031]|nr:P-loop containing nucleoside triphosphate hydrolase protein [Nemania sp. FL0031]
MDQALLKAEKLDNIHPGVKEIRQLHSFLSSSTEDAATTMTPATNIAKDEANLPCIILPSSRFSLSQSHNREDFLKDIREHFDRDLKEFRSIALHGVGGVGKSHIAHKFAYIESQKNMYDAVLWIHSDTPSAIQQSFTEVAVKLQLPGASPQNHTENKIMVLTWLQQTSCSWLLIFDNAEDAELLANYWPTSSHGHGIITTRNHNLASCQADRSIEVTSFEPDDGSKLLMHLLSLDVANDVEDGEVKSALELSEKLHGHAQAISQMAGLIHQRSWTITRFIEEYEQSSLQSNHRVLDTVWRLSFESLTTESSSILGVAAYIAPDSIPHALFEVNNVSDLPIDLKFCADNLSFSVVLENLTALALIKSDKQKRELSVHRVVQAQFINFMSASGNQQAFWNATKLLFNVFPRSGGRMGQLYVHWDRCRLYLQHVLALAGHYKESNKTTNDNARDKRLKANLYLIEQVALEELDYLSDLAIQAYATLEESEQDLYVDGLIHNQKGFSEYLRGNFELTKKHWRLGFDLHEKISPPDHRAVAWRSYNMGLVTAATEDYEGAVEWFMYAERRWTESGDETQSCVACIRGQRAQALTFLRRFDEAKECFDFSTYHLKTSQEWGWLAFTCFAEGNYFRELSQFRMAESKYREAQDAWKTGDQTRMHDFYAACLFKLGCVAMDQGDLAKAKDHFENARSILRAQSHPRAADYNRVLNKLYQLSTLMPTDTFDIEITRDGPGLFRKIFGVQTEVDFKTRESRFDSRPSTFDTSDPRSKDTGFSADSGLSV